MSEDKKQLSAQAEAEVKAEAAGPQIEVIFDENTVTFGDVRLINKWARQGDDNSDLSSEELDKALDMLDRLVVGGIDDLPLSTQPAIYKAMLEAMGQSADEKN